MTSDNIGDSCSLTLINNKNNIIRTGQKERSKKLSRVEKSAERFLSLQKTEYNQITSMKINGDVGTMINIK